MSITDFSSRYNKLKAAQQKSRMGGSRIKYEKIMRDLREDAFILLVQALRASGRGVEVMGYYRRFAQRLIEEQGKPPSLALRRLVELAGSDGTQGTMAS